MTPVYLTSECDTFRVATSPLFGEGKAVLYDDWCDPCDFLAGGEYFDLGLTSKAIPAWAWHSDDGEGEPTGLGYGVHIDGEVEILCSDSLARFEEECEAATRDDCGCSECAHDYAEAWLATLQPEGA